MEFTCKALENRSYKILLDWELLSGIENIFADNRITGPFYIISDENVFHFHGERLLNALGTFQAQYLLVPPGEVSKSLSQWKRIQNFLLANGANRRSVVIAFGGGVIGDLGGFAASTFMRGLDLIMIPTTILSQSDSSIGAKVAINHPHAKNLIGSFYQPRLVLTDPSLTSTLPPREFSAGLGEAIKYGVISDPELFETLYLHMDQLLSYNKKLLIDLITRCIRIKISVVEKDEREWGLRKILNFGHTIGHALEQATQFKRLRHGEAVAWGMLAAGWLAIQRKMWDSSEFEKLKSIIIRAGSLYPFGELNSTQIFQALKHDKKKTGSKFTFVLPEKTGKVTTIDNISQEEALAAIQYVLKLSQQHLSTPHS